MVLEYLLCAAQPLNRKKMQSEMNIQYLLHVWVAIYSESALFSCSSHSWSSASDAKQESYS